MGTQLQFVAPIAISAARVREALARAEDPLATDLDLHVWLQGGQVLPPEHIRPGRAFCRFDVKPERLAAAAEVRGEIRIAAELATVADEPTHAAASEYRVGRSQEDGQGRGPDAATTRRLDRIEGRAVRLPFAEAPGVAVSALVCFKSGLEEPSEPMIMRTLRPLVHVEHRIAAVVAKRAAPPPAVAVAVATRARHAAMEAQAEPAEEPSRPPKRDALERYEAELRARHPVAEEPALRELDKEILAAAAVERAVAAPAPVKIARAASAAPRVAHAEGCLDPADLTDEDRARRRRSATGTWRPNEELLLCATSTRTKADAKTDSIFDLKNVWSFGSNLRDEFQQTNRCPTRVHPLDFKLLLDDARAVRRLKSETRALEVGPREIPPQHRRGDAGEPLATACEYPTDGGPVHMGRFHCHGTSCFEDDGDDFDCTLYGSVANAPELWRPVRSCHQIARATDRLFVVSVSPADDVFLLVRHFKYSREPAYGVIFAPNARTAGRTPGPTALLPHTTPSRF